ncbi:hypothetical protein A2154_03095 [Candidatus Gottesmanbacteria bacterium RBG_16_43_7]|uniref:Cupin fold metalloprotein WbuC cupin domain-containing protein n=1 Tax=Candidatus Gottesmanbacteria bacterium RBG_16_43_7 TaxID=1798373 RepID=A0A1F5ZBE1_9BACT|nr:MAG: hypothetical protein A2154_03095 [Candidatus Gottesmanbacteria bacterium RBG_16_43_7]
MKNNKLKIGQLHVVEDKSAHSPSYYCLDKNILINDQTVKALYAIHMKRNYQPVRICLHRNTREKVHQMIIIMPKSYQVPPHKHLFKEESYQMIRGRMVVNIYDDRGKIIESTVLDKKNFIYKSDKKQFHAIKPMTKYVVYQEIKCGPFVRKRDSIKPKWKS